MKEIPLTKGYKALVDDDDYDLLSKFEWFVSIKKNGNAYAKRSITTRAGKGVRVTTGMHRIIMGAKKGQLVDHINGDGLDNRKSNLRIVTNTQNSANRAPQINHTSTFKGVHWSKYHKKWRSTITVNGKHCHLGNFVSEVDAAKAYDIAAVKFHGEYARTNFPRDEYWAVRNT